MRREVAPFEQARREVALAVVQLHDPVLDRVTRDQPIDRHRPCLADPWIDAVFAAAERDGAAILAAPVNATLKRVDKNRITATVDRESLWEAQTPQVFRRQLIIDAYVKRGSGTVTDDAQLVERLGHGVTIVPCSPLNLKITSRDDLKLAEQVLKVLPKPKLEGFQHPFAGDDLWR